MAYLSLVLLNPFISEHAELPIVYADMQICAHLAGVQMPLSGFHLALGIPASDLLMTCTHYHADKNPRLLTSCPDHSNLCCCQVHWPPKATCARHLLYGTASTEFEILGKLVQQLIFYFLHSCTPSSLLYALVYCIVPTFAEPKLVPALEFLSPIYIY